MTVAPNDRRGSTSAGWMPGECRVPVSFQFHSPAPPGQVRQSLNSPKFSTVIDPHERVRIRGERRGIWLNPIERRVFDRYRTGFLRPYRSDVNDPVAGRRCVMRPLSPTAWVAVIVAAVAAFVALGTAGAVAARGDTFTAAK